MVVLLAYLVACTPTCEQSCHKLLDCELADSPRTAFQECKDACTSQQQLYDSWKDDPEDKATLLEEQRECIGASTCDEIADGVCYDEALSAF